MKATTPHKAARAALEQGRIDYTSALGLPALRARIRDTLEDYFALHPEGKRLIRRAMPDPVVHGSGDGAVGPEAPQVDASEAAVARKVKPRSA